MPTLLPACICGHFGGKGFASTQDKNKSPQILGLGPWFPNYFNVLGVINIGLKKSFLEIFQQIYNNIRRRKKSSLHSQPLFRQLLKIIFRNFKFFQDLCEM